MTCNFFNDRVFTLSTSTGTGNFTTGSEAAACYENFASAFNAGDSVPYAIIDCTTGQYEIGLTTYNGTELVRNGAQKVLDSSSGGTAVAFSGNSHEIKNVVPAAWFNEVNGYIGTTAPCFVCEGKTWHDNSNAPEICVKVYTNNIWVTQYCFDSVNGGITGQLGGTIDISQVEGCYEKFSIGDTKTSLIASNHDNWLLADGSAFNPATYPELELLLTNAGLPSGILPDFKDRAIVGANGNLGNSFGSNSVSLVKNNLPNIQINLDIDSEGNHSHNFIGSDESSGSKDVWTSITPAGFAGDFDQLTAPDNYHDAIKDSGIHTHTGKTEALGNGDSVDITPQSIAMNVFIFAGCA